MEREYAKHEVFLCLKQFMFDQLLLSFEDHLGECNIHTMLYLITAQQHATYSVSYISVCSSTCFGCQHPKHVELPTEM